MKKYLLLMLVSASLIISTIAGCSKKTSNVDNESVPLREDTADSAVSNYSEETYIQQRESSGYADSDEGAVDDTVGSESADNDSNVFKEKITAIIRKYGVMKRGAFTAGIDTQKYYSSGEPISETAFGEGVLLIDIFDYDMDGSPELLSVRRENGRIDVNQGDNVVEANRSEYIFEIFESNGKECEMADSVKVGVFDLFNWSVNFENMSVFRLEADDSIDLCVETYICQQDHPDDTSLVKLSFGDGKLSLKGGVRFGEWPMESGVVCLEPASDKAIDYLSIMFPSELTYWRPLVSTSTPDDFYLSVRKEKVEELNLELLQTRKDIEDVYNRSEMEEEDYNEMHAELARVNAADCYAPQNGSIIMMAFVNEYAAPQTDKDLVLIERSVEVYVGETIEDSEDSNEEAPRQDESEDDGYILPDSDKRTLSEEDLENLDAETLILARNEIYARHGRMFKDEAIQSYFNSKTWYEGTILPEEFPEDALSEIEHKNAEYILDYENRLSNDATFDYVIEHLHGLWYSNTMSADGPMSRVYCENNNFNGEIEDIAEYHNGYIVRIAGGYSYYFGQDLNSCIYVDGWEVTEDNTYGTSGFWKPSEEQRKNFGD